MKAVVYVAATVLVALATWPVAEAVDASLKNAGSITEPAPENVAVFSCIHTYGEWPYLVIHPSEC